MNRIAKNLLIPALAVLALGSQVPTQASKPGIESLDHFRATSNQATAVSPPAVTLAAAPKTPLVSPMPSMPTAPTPPLPQFKSVPTPSMPIAPTPPLPRFQSVPAPDAQPVPVKR
jgi:hypothetical protein